MMNRTPLREEAEDIGGGSLAQTRLHRWTSSHGHMLHRAIGLLDSGSTLLWTAEHWQILPTSCQRHEPFKGASTAAQA